MNWVLTPEFLRDPYPLYRRLRQQSPRLHDPLLGRCLFRYADVQRALRDLRLSSAVTPLFMGPLPPAVRRQCREVEALLNDFLIFMDAPRHTALKAAANAHFTAAAVRRYEDSVRQRVRGRLQAGPLEFMSALAQPLPVEVTGSMLGLDDARDLGVWANDLAHFVGSGPLSWEESVRVSQSCSRLSQALGELTRARRLSPQNDLVSALLAQGLSDRDVLALISVIFAAGIDTTTGMLGNTVLALLRHPDEWRRLADEPERAERVLEEALRYDSPSHTAPRLVRESCEWGQPGEQVLIFLASAHYDPERFPEPERFWVDRPDNKHLAFSLGPHFCLGAFLARLQGRVVLEELATRFPSTRLAGEPERLERITLRQLKSLPLQLA